MADIRHQIQIAAKPERVFPLAGEAKGFTQWWAEDVTEANGAWDLGFFKRSTARFCTLVPVSLRLIYNASQQGQFKPLSGEIVQKRA